MHETKLFSADDELKRVNAHGCFDGVLHTQFQHIVNVWL